MWKTLRLRRIRRRSGERSVIIFLPALPVKKYFSRSERAREARAMSAAQPLFFKAQRSGFEKSICTFSSAGRAPAYVLRTYAKHDLNAAMLPPFGRNRIAWQKSQVLLSDGAGRSGYPLLQSLYAPLAQLVEHLTLNQGVQGSSP